MTKKEKFSDIFFTSDTTQIVCAKIRQIYKERNEAYKKKNDKKLNYKQFGDFYDWSESYVKRVMNGYFAPSYDELIKFANEEKISLDWIFGRSKKRDFTK